MNNYCLMAGQMMSLVTHNANRCVSFMKIVGFVWNCMTEWFFGPSSELAAMTAHLPGCRCKMSQHKLSWAIMEWNLALCWTSHGAPSYTTRAKACMGCKHKNSAFHHSIQNVVHGALYLWLKILIVQEAEFDSTAVGIRSNCIIFWAWKGEKGSGQMCSV